MIMAGRGRRLTDPKDEPRKIGAPPTDTPENTAVDVPLLTKKINDIDTNDINPTLMNDIKKIIEQLFTSETVMKDVISKLHDQSLDDVEFGEKLVAVLECVLFFEVDNTNVRNVFLLLLQSDFEAKQEMSSSDPKKFVNAVMLFGNFFNRITIGGKPLSILVLALFEYFDLLLKGDEEQLKTLVKQLLINGSKLVEQDKYKQLMQTLRNTLITRELNSSSKCWILLAIEFTSNGIQPLNEGAKDFYVSNLGEEFTKLESLIPAPKDTILLSPLSPKSVKSQDSGQDTGSWRSKKINSSPSESSSAKADLCKGFGDMNIKVGSGRKIQSPPGKFQKKEGWKSGGGMKQNSGHDDRFEKDENFYGVQKPRQTKPDNQKKRFNDKIGKKEFDHFKTDLDGTVMEPQQKPAKEELWE